MWVCVESAQGSGKNKIFEGSDIEGKYKGKWVKISQLSLFFFLVFLSSLGNNKSWTATTEQKEKKGEINKRKKTRHTTSSDKADTQQHK